MTYRRTLMAIALIAVIGAAFYAGMVSERSGVVLPAPGLVSDAQAQQMESFTLCELYAAFASLEAAYGHFADVLAGLRCGGIDCDLTFDLPRDVGGDLDWLIKYQGRSSDGGGVDPCRTDPCKILKADFGKSLSEVLSRSPAVGTALEAILQRVELEEIEYLSDAPMHTDRSK